jgi:hypothetical protein
LSSLRKSRFKRLSRKLLQLKRSLSKLVRMSSRLKQLSLLSEVRETKSLQHSKLKSLQRQRKKMLIMRLCLKSRRRRKP